jgi:hypothetical protein
MTPVSQMIRPDMAIYPVEFYRRSEEKWKRRARARGATRNLIGSSERGLAPNQKGDDILARRPWLLAIGQGLQREYRALEQPVHGRLAALLKKLARIAS